LCNNTYETCQQLYVVVVAAVAAATTATTINNIQMSRFSAAEARLLYHAMLLQKKQTD